MQPLELRFRSRKKITEKNEDTYTEAELIFLISVKINLIHILKLIPEPIKEPKFRLEMKLPIAIGLTQAL